MTCHNKETLEQMLFDVVNELDLSDVMVDEHGQHGTEPAVLVRLVLEQKNKTIRLLKAGFADAANTTQHDPSKPIACAFCGAISMTVPIKPTHTQELQKQLRELDDEGYQPSTGAIGNKAADALASFAREIEARIHEELRKQEPVAWVVVRQSVLDVGNGDDVRTGGRPELGYALLENSVTYRNEDQASAAIKAKGLPLGWVYMPLSRLLPNLAAPIPPTPTPSQQEALDAINQLGGQDPMKAVQVLRDFILARPDTEGSGK